MVEAGTLVNLCCHRGFTPLDSSFSLERLITLDGSGLSDEQLVSQRQQQVAEPSSEMAFAIYLFEAAKLNSEIQYIAQSIIRDTPRYAYPRVTNINDW
jgi:hypothetical protein